MGFTITSNFICPKTGMNLQNYYITIHASGQLNSQNINNETKYSYSVYLYTYANKNLVHVKDSRIEIILSHAEITTIPIYQLIYDKIKLKYEGATFIDDL